jgi:Fe-S-cluster containining protein
MIMKSDQLFTKLCFDHYDVYVPFECRRCGKRCRTYTPRFSDDDVEEIARYLHEPPPAVRRRYEERHKTRYHTHALPCSFFNEETNECSIYPLRPQCCRLYPFSFRGGDVNCPAYRHHIRIAGALHRQDHLRDSFDSSFCPEEKTKPIPEHKWPAILNRFMEIEKSHMMIWKFIQMNTISTIRFGALNHHSLAVTI